MALLLPFVFAACATSPPKDARSSDQPSRDLALHIIEVDPDGEGDELDASDLPKMEPADAELCPEAEKADKKSNDDAIVLREKFKCVIKTAIYKHKRWSNPKNKPWPCGADDQQPLCLVFYFNGGRNSKGDAIQSAGASYQQIETAGMYPIYMVWPTGDLESYGEDLLRVRTGRLTKPYDPATFASIPGRFPSDLLRGLASTPAAWATSLFEFYNTGFGFGSERYMLKRDTSLHVSAGERIRACEGPEQRDCKTFTIDADRNLYFSPEADLRVQDGAAAIAKQVGSWSYHIATTPVRVLATWPMVGFDEAGWRNMVRRTRTSVRSAAEFPDEFAEAAEDGSGRTTNEAIAAEIDCPLRAGGHLDEREKLEGNFAMLRGCYPRGSGGFARVFQWLESCMTGQAIAEGADDCPLTNPEDRMTLRNARIVMIGHSMGTIVINELLQLFPNLPYESLVYMAGAASVMDTARAVTPVLVNNRGCTKFHGLMLHPMNEARESTFYGLLPSGSLLVYVDEFLEVPKTVPDRTVGQWRNLRATRHVFFPEEARRWMLFHVFDRAEGPPENPNPTTHGGFNDKGVPFWRETFWKPESVEFPEPQADCGNLFTTRLDPAAIEVGVGASRAITIPAEEVARKWQRVWQEVDSGKTVAITSGGETIARIVPMPGDQEDAAVLAH